MHPLLDCVKTKNNILSVGNDYLILCHKLYILMYQKMLKHIYPVIYPSKVTLSILRKCLKICIGDGTLNMCINMDGKC